MASKFDKAQELETIESRDHATLDEADSTDLEKSMDPSQELDDPHVAALHGDTKLELSFRTVMSIVFLGLAVVAPISCAQIMVGAVLEVIATELEMTPAFVNWVLAGWALAATVPVIIVGKVSDIFGRRWVMITGNVVVLIGCTVSGTAKRQEQLVSGSIIIGFGFGFNQLAFIAIPELCPFKYRGLGLAWLEICLFVPWGVAGGILGNLLAQHASWRYVYYIGIIYAGTALIGTFVFYYPPQGSQDIKGKSWQDVMKNFDYVGSFLFVAGLPVFILAFSWAGTPGHAWSSPSVIAPLVIGALTLLAAFVYEMKWADPEYAFMPPRLMAKFREFSSICVAGFVSAMVYYSGAQLVPQANVYVFGLDPTQVGLWLLPNGFGQFAGSTIVPGLLLRYTKAPKFWICAAVFLQTLFVGLYAWAITGHPAAWQAFQFFGQGCFDWIVTCGVVNLSLHVRQSDLGLAVSLFSASRNLGGSIGTAIFITILNSTVAGKLAHAIPFALRATGYQGQDGSALIAAARSAALGDVQPLRQLDSSISDAAIEAAIEAFRTSYAHAYQIVYYSAIPFGVLSLVVCLFIKDAGKYMTNHTAVHIKQQKT